MDDFLVDLYALTKGSARTPREDFLSLCLGNAVQRDPALAAALLGKAVTEKGPSGKDTARHGEREDRVRSWLAPPLESDPARRIDVLAQVSAVSGSHEHGGWADLRVLLSGPIEQGLIFEAKVGWSAPTKAQLSRYASAKEGDIIVALVQENARSLCPKDVPVVTWDDVAGALAEPCGVEWLDVDRRQLLALLAHSGVIDARRGLPPEAWKQAKRANRIYAALRPRLEAMLAELGPNDAVRRELAANIEEQREYCEASRGWGPGVVRTSAYGSSFVSGLTLSLDAGDHANELVWYLEVCPTREEVRKRLRGREFKAWWPSKGSKGWFTTRLPHVSRGTGKLAKPDLERVVQHARDALRVLHNGTPGASWAAQGPGAAPGAGKDKSIPELRAGIRDHDAVTSALRAASRQIVAELASPGVPLLEADVQRKASGWVTKAGARVWAGATSDLEAIRVVLLRRDGAAQAKLSAAVAIAPTHIRERFPMAVETVDEGAGVRGPCLRIALTELNWQSADLAPVVCGLVRSSL